MMPLVVRMSGSEIAAPFTSAPFGSKTIDTPKPALLSSALSALSGRALDSMEPCATWYWSTSVS